jgi:hypothetical protein
VHHSRKMRPQPSTLFGAPGRNINKCNIKYMTLEIELNELIADLDKTHPNGFLQWDLLAESEMLDFVTTQNGSQRYFTKKAWGSLLKLSSVIHANKTDISSKIKEAEFINVFRQSIAELHAGGDFSSPDVDSSSRVAALTDRLLQDVTLLAKEYTHYLPAWTLGMEAEKSFVLGPVTIMTREQWIDSVDFPESAKTSFLNQSEANFKWKELLKDALSKSGNSSVELHGLAGAVFPAISSCSSVIKITISEYEKTLSQQVARKICKTALDSISLSFGGPEFFHQQTLCDERLQPVISKSLVETHGFLWLPGTKLGQRLPRLSYPQVNAELRLRDHQLEAFQAVLNALVKADSHRHPKLANRWATALDWFGEGCRESNDAVAIAKIATSLDVLACVGKYKGILEMLENLLELSENDVVTSGPGLTSSLTLKRLVKDIYDNGRSRILHGTSNDRLQSFSKLRGYAVQITRFALLECVLRLQAYAGEDADKEFRIIPKQRT